MSTPPASAPSPPPPVPGAGAGRRRDRDKRVKLSVKVPKALRSALREEAERRGMSVDELVGILLGDRITR